MGCLRNGRSSWRNSLLGGRFNRGYGHFQSGAKSCLPRIDTWPLVASGPNCDDALFVRCPCPMMLTILAYIVFYFAVPYTAHKLTLWLIGSEAAAWIVVVITVIGSIAVTERSIKRIKSKK